jgi:hypothetical protein
MTRRSSVPAGSVAVTASATVDGKPRSVVLEAPHDAHACK